MTDVHTADFLSRMRQKDKSLKIQYDELLKRWAKRQDLTKSEMARMETLEQKLIVLASICDELEAVVSGKKEGKDVVFNF